MNFMRKPNVINGATVTQQNGLSRFMSRVYNYMGLSILISAITAYFVSQISLVNLVSNGIGMWILLIAWFVMPFIIGRQAYKNVTVATAELVIYAMLTGAMFSSIFLIYTKIAITAAFISSAILFFIMSIIGKVTHKNMAKLGTQLFGALIGLIVVMFINMFLRISGLELFLNIACVIIFALMVMFETNQMKKLYYSNSDSLSNLNGLAINGALMLYLDFINIFTSLLEIFGGVGNSSNN